MKRHTFKKRRNVLHPDAPLLNLGHGAPISRRDMLGRGLLTGAAFGSVGMMGLFSNPREAMAALSSDLEGMKTDCGIQAAGAGKIPFICFDLAGGANIAGSNVLVGGQGGQEDFLTSNGYSKLGLPGSMAPSTDPGVVNRDFGLAFHSDSPFLIGMQEKAAAAASNTNGCVIPARSENDTANNPHNPMYGIFNAGADGELLSLIDQLNNDDAVHGILVQLPVPDHIDERKVISAIDPSKDVDGFHPINAGRLATGQKALVPCTPVGCVILAKRAQADLTGLNAVVIGRSNIVGKPVAQLLLQENCTVTVAHSRTKNLPEVVGRADLVVAAAGQCEMVKGDWIKPGAIVIDVGIHRTQNEDGKTKLKGDVDFDSAVERAGSITPVPGGVGPMTIACLLRNSVVACARLNGLPDPEL